MSGAAAAATAISLCTFFTQLRKLGEIIFYVKGNGRERPTLQRTARAVVYTSNGVYIHLSWGFNTSSL